MISASAFAPGHVTGFFTIDDGAEGILERGSRGAGFSVSLGARVTVRKAFVPRHLLNGRETTMEIVSSVLGIYGTEVDVKRLEVDVTTELPISQGFGMSGAIALATAMGIERLMRTGIDPVMASHAAEIECRTGLGDVAGQFLGGFELRLRAGVPVDGKVMKLDLRPDKIYLKVMGEGLETTSVLDDDIKRKAISKFGEMVNSRFREKPTLDSFVALSRDFTLGSGLATDDIRALMMDNENVSMCMLGNSIFSFWPIDGAFETRLGPSAHYL